MSSSRFNSQVPTPHSLRHDLAQSPISSFHPSRPSHAHPSPLPNLTNDQINNLRRQSHLSTLSLSPGRPQHQPHSATTAGRARPGAKARDRFSFGDEASLGFEAGAGGQGLEEEGEWLMVDRIRCWRNDAMTQHLYGTAQFWGAKVFAMTGKPIQS